MKTIEKYASFAEHLFTDQKVQKYGMMLVKHGIKGAAKKVNPAVMILDAGLAVIDACNSYLNYAKEKEITQQIQAENRLIKAQLDQQLKELNLTYDTLLAEGDNRYYLLSRAVSKNRLFNKNNLSQIKELLTIAKSMQTNVKHEIESGISFVQLQSLQNNLDEFIRALMMLLMQSIED